MVVQEVNTFKAAECGSGQNVIDLCPCHSNNGCGESHYHKCDAPQHTFCALRESSKSTNIPLDYARNGCDIESIGGMVKDPGSQEEMIKGC